MESRAYFPTTRDLSPGPFRRIADGLANLLYPDSCFICSSHLSRIQDCGVCDACWLNVRHLEISPPFCVSCGLPCQAFDPGPGHLCGECTSEMPSFSGARSYGYYRAELRLMIREFKFHDRRNLAGLLGPLIARTFTESWDRNKIDLIVPLPLHPSRKRARGFNQAALLASSLARLVALPCVEAALSRTRPTEPQVSLSDSERRRNVRNAFQCLNPNLVADKRALLVDDVMTTGATLQSASLALLEAGARRVSVLTVARAVPGAE